MVKEPAVAERLINNGIDLVGNDPKGFAAMIAEDMTFWAEALKIAGLRDK